MGGGGRKDGNAAVRREADSRLTETKSFPYFGKEIPAMLCANVLLLQCDERRSYVAILLQMQASLLCLELVQVRLGTVAADMHMQQISCAVLDTTCESCLSGCGLIVMSICGDNLQRVPVSG